MAPEIQEIDVFRKFDVVSDTSDHHYASEISSGKKTTGDCFTNHSNTVYKKIMQEWKILEKHLPDSIFVRAYENRIDLLQAVIIGAAGTPYHDGLYFFDIAFPSDYPSKPPLVHYRSFGLRMNPNLYANGRVCLSLVNTWPGKKSEKWNPNESTILQVLVSIQALVLNEKPYFNEPGHGIWPGRAIWERKSNSYNEDVFILSCKTMLYLLRRPPKNFEGFVAEHFKQRAGLILLACNAYIKGRVRVGYYKIGAETSIESGSSQSVVEVSAKFKVSISQLYPELFSWFRRNGASLGNLNEHLVEKKAKTAPCKTPVVVVKKNTKKSSSGIGIRVLGKLKKILGLGLRKKHEKSIKKKTTSS